MTLKNALSITTFLVFPLLAPLIGGGLLWVRGWVYVAAWAISLAVASIVQRYHPEIGKARAKIWVANTKPADKFFQIPTMVLRGIAPLVGGFSRVPWGPSAVTGSLLYAAGLLPYAWSLAANPFAEPSIRIQSDRGHKVVDAGPYRWVRHPLYLGAILMQSGNALILGSKWPLLLSAIVVALYVARTAAEDRVLTTELAGYSNFTRRTRYALIPGLW